MNEPLPNSLRITFLGTGPSSGVPGIGVGWGACDPNNPKNCRSRQSILVEKSDKRLLVDTTPDLRSQFLRHDVHSLDAVLYTHAHADHMNGLDDLRGINKAIKRPIPVFADAPTHAQMKERFGYALQPMGSDEPSYFVRPVLDMTEFAPGETIKAADVCVATFEQDHGYSKTVGFRFDDVVYSTDVKSLSEDVLNTLSNTNVDIWIIGVFSWKTHWTHADVDLALSWIERVKPRRAILTHLGNQIDYAELMSATPEHVVPAFDGMQVSVSSPGGDIRISD